MDAVKLHDDNAGVFRKRYDDKNSFKDRLSIWIDLFKKYMPTKSNVIELGCGPGLMAKEILNMGNHLDAIDGSPMMINKAKEEIGNQQNVQFIESYITVDFLRKFDNEKYDHAVSSSVLEYIKEFDEIMLQVNRILKPGGTFIFSIPNSQSLYRNIESLTYSLFGKPSYRKFIFTQKSKNEIQKLNQKGWHVEEIICQGEVPYYSKITSFLPGKFQKPMLLVILRKNNHSN
jgi:predicted TPR repeat methyltransferase